MSRCQQEMREAGLAYPRTCERCGLFGPCTRESLPKPTTLAMDYNATVGPIHPAAPDVPGDEAYPWANGDGQILLRSFIFEQLSTPQSTLDFKKEIPSMEAFRTWIMTGTFQDAAPSKLKVVQP